MTMVQALACGLLERVSPRRFAAVAGLVVVAELIPGALDTFGVMYSYAFDLDGERNVPSAVSTLLLLAASTAAFDHWVAAGAGGQGKWERRANLFVAALLAYMALDEFGQLHEKAEARSGIDWQTLYAPIFVAAAVAGGLLVRAWRDRSAARALFLAGAAAWFLSQLGEHLEYDSHDRHVAGFQYYVLFEEVFESIGSTLLTIAFLVAGRQALGRLAERRAHAALVSSSPLARTP